MTRGASSARTPQDEAPCAMLNRVVLSGRLAAVPEDRELPSGDAITTWRLVVTRPPGQRRRPDGVRATPVDTFDCVAWTAASRRSIARASPGQQLLVEGALRRRFWRAGAGVASRCEVEVTSVRRLPSPPQ